jgi:hypothetical protein
MKFLPAIMPIPERTHPGSSSIVHSSYRCYEDFGRDLPAICRPREGFFIISILKQSSRYIEDDSG